MDATAKRDWSALDVCYQLPKRPNFPINCTVELRHPGLPDDGASNILFCFPAYDSNGGGLHHSIALTACGIVTGNKFTGYLSSTATGPPVAEALDAVLRGPFYYFHPHPKQPGRDQPSTMSPCSCSLLPPYPVYPTFSDWPFPHDNLPSWWPPIPQGSFQTTSRAVSAISSRVRVRDESCRLTGSSEETEVPHIIPVKETTWFAQNNMRRYSYDNTSVNNSANLFVLREDLHTAYDNFRWTIAPKTTPTALQPKWYFVYLDTTEEMGSQFHNVEMRPMLGVRSEYLLAGFARAIFYLLLPFLNNYSPKRLIGQSVNTQDPAGKEVAGVWAAEIFGLPGARAGSTSPQKGRSPKRQQTEDSADSCNGSAADRETLPGPDHSRKRGRSLPNDDDPPPPYAGSLQPSERSKKNPDAPDDLSCTCEINTSPVAERSTSLGAAEPPDNLVLADVMCRSKNCRTWAESEHHEAMRAEGLKLERTRSNVREWWENQLEWAKECGLRKHRGYDKTQWFWVIGAEDCDDNGEYPDTNEEFGRMVGWR
ncbi:MAG: hypothetical protein Q9192_001071 [Flavoplaca navasiana]